MELRFDPDQWLDASHTTPPKGADALLADAQADWHALAAKLAASHAYQRSLVEGEAARRSPAGSFDPVAAQQMHLYATATEDQSIDPPTTGGAYHAVNPVASGVRKTMSGMPSGVAGAPFPAVED